MNATRPSMIFLVLLCGTSLASSVTLTVNPQVITLNEGERVIFTCQTSNVKWRLPDGTILGPQPTPQNFRIYSSGSLLSISDTMFEDRGLYTCILASDETQFGTAELKITVPPHIQTVPLPLQEIHVGETTLIRCEVDRGYPEAGIYWYKDSRQVNLSDPRLTQEDDGLLITDIQAGDEGLYECYVYNQVNHDSLEINVVFRAPPQFLNMSVFTAVTINQGDSADLDCSAVGAPQPNYTWAVPPNSTAAERATNRGPILEISSSSTRDLGLYKCVVDNGVGNISRGFEVTVAVKPFPEQDSQNHTVVPGQSMFLPCPVQATPPPSYTWYHYDPTAYRESPITDDAKFQVQSNGSLYVKALEVSDFNEECFTVLLCQATNQAGASNIYHTVNLDNTVCLTEIQTPSPPPTESPTISVLTEGPSSVSDFDSGKDSKNGDEFEEDDENEIRMALTIVFSTVLVVLFVAVVTVIVYILRLYCYRRSHQYPRTYAKTKGRRPRLAVNQTPQDATFTATLPSVSVNSLPSDSTHTSITIDDGTYSKLNHSLSHQPTHSPFQHSMEPRHTSTSSSGSGNSITPLLESQTSLEDDAFTADEFLSQSTRSTCLHSLSSIPELDEVTGSKDATAIVTHSHRRSVPRTHPNPSPQCRRTLPLSSSPLTLSRQSMSSGCSTLRACETPLPPVPVARSESQELGLGIVTSLPLPEYLQLVDETTGRPSHYETVH